MVNVTFTKAGVSYDPNAFYQYDYGRTLIIHGLDLPASVQVHFARKNAPAEIVIGETVDGVTTVRVPASTLEFSGEFTVYIFVVDQTSGRTYKSISFNTRQREKPADYAPPDEPNVIQQFMDKLDRIIEEGIATYEPEPVYVNQMVKNYVQQNLITNNDAATIPGTAWDAVRGKILRSAFDQLVNGIDNTIRNYVQQNLITNNDGATVAGTAWDAVRGKALRDDLNLLNNNLATSRTTLATGVVLERSGKNRVLHVYSATSDANSIISSVVLSATDRPPQMLNSLCCYGDASTIGFVAIHTNGTVKLTNIIGAPAPSINYITGQISWIV